MGRGDRIPITTERRISFEGYFDVSALNDHIKEYLEQTRHYDTTLRDLEEKTLEGSKGITIKIDAEQQFNDYYMINIRYVLDASGKDAEIEINGKKKIVQKGKAILSISAFIEPDYLHKRDQGPMSQFLGKIWDEFLGQKELNTCIAGAMQDINGMINIFKQEVNSKLQK